MEIADVLQLLLLIIATINLGLNLGDRRKK